MIALVKMEDVEGGPNEAGDAMLPDLRFRSLVGTEAWDSLPQAVKLRFAKRLGPGQSVNYAGQVLDCRMSALGWLIAQGCRLIGAPLPLEREGGVAAVVSVTEDGATSCPDALTVPFRQRSAPRMIRPLPSIDVPAAIEIVWPPIVIEPGKEAVAAV